MFKIFFLMVCLTASLSWSAIQNSNAKKLFELLLPEPAVTKSFLTAYNKRQYGKFSKIYKYYYSEVNDIVKNNYSEPIISNGANLISKKLSPTEIDEVLRFYSTPAGAKALQILTKRPRYAKNEVLSPEEFLAIDAFYKKGTGLKWIMSVTEVTAQAKNQKSVFARNARSKLTEFISSRK